MYVLLTYDIHKEKIFFKSSKVCMHTHIIISRIVYIENGAMLVGLRLNCRVGANFLNNS